MKLRTKIFSLSGFNISLLIAIVFIVASIFSSLIAGFTNIIEQANRNKELTSTSQQDITSAKRNVDDMVGETQGLDDQIRTTNNTIKILEKKVVYASENLSSISQTIEDVLDGIEDEETQDLLFDMADEIGNLQEIMKREALVSLQATVKSMDKSSISIGKQLDGVKNILTNLEHIQESGLNISAASDNILSISNQFEKSIHSNRIFLSVLILIFALGAVIVSVFISRSITIPLSRVVNMVKDIAEGEGDLTKRLEEKSKDELGELASWLNKFINRLNRIIVNITTHANTVTASSQSLLIVSDKVSSGTEEMSQRANTVAAASEEMSSNMSSVAAASEEASTNISLVSESASSMQHILSEIAQNCDRARNISNEASGQVTTATERVNSLGSAAQEISKVTEVITEIADQTNLLALNATIEAARAGDAGKGFAVVAGEIKELAQQTTDATKDIKERIGKIQNYTGDTVLDVKQIATVITDVNTIVETIADSIEEQSQNATEVALSIEQASNGITEVTSNVSQVSQVSSEISKDIAGVNVIADEMSNMSSQLNQNATDLSTLSSDLRDMISVFKVSADDSAPRKNQAESEANLPDLMPWKDGYTLGIDEIDRQHKKIIELINKQYKCMKIGSDPRKASEILAELAKYNEYHFQTEEKYFSHGPYPNAESHIANHRMFAKRVKEHQQKLAEGTASVNIDLLDFLMKWWDTHILDTDMKFARHYKSQQK